MKLKDGICAIAINYNHFLGYICRDSDFYRVYTSGNKLIGEYELLSDKYIINPEAIYKLESCFIKYIPFNIIMETDVSLSGHKFDLFIQDYDINGVLLDCYYKNSKSGKTYSILFPQNNECFIKNGEVWTYD